MAVLLGLAELLADYNGGPTVELVPFNGEDDYANPGEMLWLSQNGGRFGDIVLGINIDDAGLAGTVNDVSLYGCPPQTEVLVRSVIELSPHMAEGPQWFQSDHAIFGMYGAQAMAIASSEMERFMAEYAHSERDRIERADPALLADAARFIRDLIAAIGGESG